MTSELQHLLPSVIKIVKQVGHFIKSESQHFLTGSVEYKTSNDLVSYVDRCSETMLCEALDRLHPGLGFETEEQQVIRQGATRWIIDPLDGTTNFIHQIPLYAISVALAQDNEILLGVVYEINNQDLYSAIKGQGACKNDTPIHVSPTAHFNQSLIATGFPISDFPNKSKYLNCLGPLMTQTRGIRRMGAAAVDLCFTAEGKFDLFFEPQLKPWDVAAGALILESAGGLVSDFSGGTDWLYGKSLIGRNPHMHKAFLNFMKTI